MIEIGKYYRIQTEFGERTIKALEIITAGIYGIYSISNCTVPQDNQGSLIHEDSPKATLAESTVWDNWYKS
jgi:hypothetical protein